MRKPEGIPIVGKKLFFFLDASCCLDKHDTCATSSYTPLILLSRSTPGLPDNKTISNPLDFVSERTIKDHHHQVRVPTSPWRSALMAPKDVCLPRAHTEPQELGVLLSQHTQSLWMGCLSIHH